MTDTGVTAINIPYPDASDRQLRIAVGACRLTIRPGDGEAWVTGTHKDPTGARPPKIAQEGGTIRITEEHTAAEMWSLLSAGFPYGVPSYELTLGKGQPYWLTIEAGASENNLDLGGLPITRLVVKHGAGRTAIDFSAPNPKEMSLIEIGSGAGKTEINNLANANFAELLVEGGAAAYTINFAGTLRRDAHARVTTGMASVEIGIPAATAAKLTVESPLGHVEVGEEFTRKEGACWTPAAVNGQTPMLTVYATVALGTLRIRTV
jgi:hypothetical protein